MSNSAIVSYNNNYQIYEIKVNGISVYGNENQSICQTIRDRLNLIFADSNRDLDFITPSYANGMYVVSCPLVRKNVNQKTYFYDSTSNASNNYYPEKLYESTNWNDSTLSSSKSAILTISNNNTAPWYDALVTANKIRSAINLNFNDARGNSTCKQLVKPTNHSDAVSSVISSDAICDVYGHPDQGVNPGEYSSYSSDLGFAPQNILSASTGSGEVFHPQDLTCALTMST